MTSGGDGMEWIRNNVTKPIENKRYLVTTKYGGYVTEMSFYEGKWNASKECTKHALDDEYILAWMEMPEAYKEEV